MTQTGTRFPAMLANLNTLLSRYGESMMWLARYMERIENLARILEVTEAFVRNPDGSPGWDSILQINSDEERYAALMRCPRQKRTSSPSISRKARIRHPSAPWRIWFGKTPVRRGR